MSAPTEVLRIDDWYEMLVVGGVIGGTVLLALRMILKFVRSGGRVKGSLKGVTVEEAPETPTVPLPSVCVLEHTQILDNLRRSVEELHADRLERGMEIRNLYRMSKTLIYINIAQFELQLGKKQNGQVRRALESLEEISDLFDETTIGKVGG